jgi:diguanylate cyclase (GGDEF)-like protein
MAARRNIFRAGRALDPRELKRRLASAQVARMRAQRQVSELVERNAMLERRLAVAEANEAQALRLAHHDALTGLPNRSLLLDRLDQAMRKAQRRGQSVALLLIDLDGFKRINDELGHAAGDELLRITAGRLTSSIRAADTACRYGGDEFVIMLSEVEHADDVVYIAAKIRAKVATPCAIEGHWIRITASLGAAVYPGDGSTYEQLLRQADKAMYREKSKAPSVPLITQSDGGVRNANGLFG